MAPTENSMPRLWHNNSLCLRPEDNKGLDAISVVYHAFRAGLKARPKESVGGYTGANENAQSREYRP